MAVSRTAIARTIRRPHLSEEVAARLRASIMTGELRPGEFIRLDETAVRLGVSVTPVREALLTLRGEGMVDAVPHRGYAVVPLSRGDIEDIFWLQARVACELAQHATRRIESAQIDVLAGLNAALRQATTPEAIARAEFEFHRFFNYIADRPKLAWFLVHAARYTPYQLFAADPTWIGPATQSHEKLVAALRDGDLDEVIAQTQSQFTDGARRLVAHLDAAGVWAGR